MAKRRKLKKNVKRVMLLFFLLVVVLFYLNFKKHSKDSSEHDVISLSYSVVDNAESDSNVVNKMFAKGMSSDSFNHVLKYQADKITSKQEYKKINYNFNKKLCYKDVEYYLNKINNSDIADLYVIGSSADNRNIYGLEIGNGSKVIFLDANIHAAETANTHILIQFMSEVVNMYESGNTNVKNALNDFKLVVMPCMNPDGYEIFTNGIESISNKELWVYKNKNKINFKNLKSNANGVDINRNFPTQNAGLYYKSKGLLYNVSLEKNTGSKSYFGGYSLGSEPETKAAMYFMLKHYRSVVSYINLHSQGRVIYSGKPNLSNEFNNLSRKFASKISNINKYIVYGIESEEVGEGNDGSATDFMSEIAHKMPFSSKTGRLSSNKYIDPKVDYIVKYPVITLETIKTYTRNTEIFKDEYYNYGLRKVLFSLIGL